MPSAPPIVFVSGCERSGTTLLVHTLARHAVAVGMPESVFVGESIPATGRELAERIWHNWRLSTWPVPRVRLRSALDEVEAREPVIGVMRRLASTLGERQAADIAAGAPLVDGTPWNVKLAPQLLDAFPGARFIHLVRDGRAVFSSVKPLEWGPTTAISGAQWWASTVAAGLMLEQHEGAIRVRYEDLLEDPRGAVQGICDALGLERRPAPSPDTEAAIGAFSRNQHRLVSSEPAVGRMHAWREELAPREVELFEGEAGSVLQGLGYHRVSDAVPPGLARRWQEDLIRAVQVITSNVPRRLVRRGRHGLDVRWEAARAAAHRRRPASGPRRSSGS